MKAQVKRMFAVLFTVLLLADSQSAACSSLISLAAGPRDVQAAEISVEGDMQAEETGGMEPADAMGADAGGDAASRETYVEEETEESSAADYQDAAIEAPSDEGAGEAYEDGAEEQASEEGLQEETQEPESSTEVSVPVTDPEMTAGEDAAAAGTEAAADAAASTDVAADAAASTDVAADAAASTDVAASTEVAAEIDVPVPVKRVYEYNDKNVSVVATLETPDAVPDDAELVVTPVTPETDGYNYDAYMEALNQGVGLEPATTADDGSGQAAQDGDAAARTYTEENTLLYDIAFMGAAKDENGLPVPGKTVELQPEAGTVNISVQFKKNQLSDGIGATSAENVQVVHLPLADEVKETVDSTREATDIAVSDIVVQAVAADVAINEPEAEKSVVETTSFQTNNFSVFAVSLKAAGASEIAVPEANSFEESSFNVIKSDFGAMANIGLIAFDSLILNQHCNSNFATEHLSTPVGQAIGTNSLNEPELFYIGSTITGSSRAISINLKDGAGQYNGSQIITPGNISITEENGGVKIGDQASWVNGPEKKLEPFRQEKGSKFIDLNTWKENAETLSSNFSTYEDSMVVQKQDASYLHYIENANTTVAALTLKASDLSHPLRLEDDKAKESHVLVLNIDANGADSVSFPGLEWIDPSTQEPKEGTYGEVNTWTKGNVILNIIDTKAENNLFKGTVTINGKTTALILAPDAIVDAKFNVNGQIIANNIKINEEFHRDSFTFKSSITVRGGLKARKTLDGSNKLGNINTIFQFELSAVSAKNMSNEAITDIPMPDYASDSERSAKKMTCDSDLNGVINFKEEGDYTYKIVEKRPDNSIAYEDGYYADGYLYDGNEYTVTVHARRTQTGGIGIYGYDIKKNDEDLGFMDYETGKQNGVVTFANSTLSPDKACVKIKKEFDGEWPEEGFKFELKGISKEENGHVEQWQSYFVLPTYENYEAGMSKTVKVTEDSPYADFGIIKYNPNDSQKYTFELKEIVEGATPTEDPNKVLL